jgi:hypothetical protein
MQIKRYWKIEKSDQGWIVQSNGRKKYPIYAKKSEAAHAVQRSLATVKAQWGRSGHVITFEKVDGNYCEIACDKSRQAKSRTMYSISQDRREFLAKLAAANRKTASWLIERLIDLLTKEKVTIHEL